MTGRPNNGWDEGTTYVASSHLELARLRAFCLLNAILYFCTGVLSLGRAAQGRAARAGRIARVLALLVAAICAAGVVVVLLLPIADTTLPTALATGVVIVFALYTYAGMAKLPH